VFWTLGAFGSRRVLDDELVLEAVKAEGEGLNLAADRIGPGWSFDEKNEFCARTEFGRNPRAMICCSSSQVESLDLEPVLVGISSCWWFLRFEIWGFEVEAWQ
jgi:hypothetical protein